MGTRRIEAPATVVRAERVGGESANQGEAMAHDAVLDFAFGKVTYDLELEVEPPGQAAYRAQGRFKLPQRAGGLRRLLRFGGDVRIVAGVVLPALVAEDDAHDIEIDWKRFFDGGGIQTLKTAGAEAKAARTVQATRDHLGSRPKELTKRREQVLRLAPAQVDAVRSGHLSPSEFEEWLGYEERVGAVSDDEAAALRRDAGVEAG